MMSRRSELERPDNDKGSSVPASTTKNQKENQRFRGVAANITITILVILLFVAVYFGTYNITCTNQSTTTNNKTDCDAHIMPLNITQGSQKWPSQLPKESSQRLHSNMRPTICEFECALSSPNEHEQELKKLFISSNAVYITLQFSDSDFPHDELGYLNKPGSVIDPYTWTWAKGEMGEYILNLPQHIFIGLSLWTLKPGVEYFSNLNITTEECPNFMEEHDECKMYLIADHILKLWKPTYLNEDSHSIKDVQVCNEKVPESVKLQNFLPYVGLEHTILYSTDMICWTFSLQNGTTSSNIRNVIWISTTTWVFGILLAVFIPLIIPYMYLHASKPVDINGKTCISKGTDLSIGLWYLLFEWDKHILYPVQLFRLIFIYTPIVLLLLYSDILVYNLFDISDRKHAWLRLKSFERSKHVHCVWYVLFHEIPVFILLVLVLHSTDFKQFGNLFRQSNTNTLRTLSLIDHTHQENDSNMSAAGTNSCDPQGNDDSSPNSESEEDSNYTTGPHGDDASFPESVREEGGASNGPRGDDAFSRKLGSKEANNKITEPHVDDVASQKSSSKNGLVEVANHIYRLLLNWLDITHLYRANEIILKSTSNTISHFLLLGLNIILLPLYYIVSLPGIYILKLMFMNSPLPEFAYFVYREIFRQKWKCIIDFFQNISLPEWLDKLRSWIWNLFYAKVEANEEEGEKKEEEENIYLQYFFDSFRLIGFFMLLLRFLSFAILVAEILIYVSHGMIRHYQTITPYFILGVCLLGYLITSVTAISSAYFSLLSVIIDIVKVNDQKLLKHYKWIDYIEGDLFWYVVNKCKPLRVEVYIFVMKIGFAATCVASGALIINRFCEGDSLGEIAAAILTLLVSWFVPYIIETAFTSKHSDQKLINRVKEQILEFKLEQQRDNSASKKLNTNNQIFQSVSRKIIEFFFFVFLVTAVVLLWLIVDHDVWKLPILTGLCMALIIVLLYISKANPLDIQFNSVIVIVFILNCLFAIISLWNIFPIHEDTSYIISQIAILFAYVVIHIAFIVYRYSRCSKSVDFIRFTLFVWLCLLIVGMLGEIACDWNTKDWKLFATNVISYFIFYLICKWYNDIENFRQDNGEIISQGNGQNIEHLRQDNGENNSQGNGRSGSQVNETTPLTKNENRRTSYEAIQE